eukprot:gnl/TRDRNA2_/TRDRNA2_174371_c0_seq23.p1 gnl/TRDRNA2_/TRDRNA2_174371_c0~~gnl/TRDRNA2_/TRDRNA2_174371_c0_seq23.p1  ORF type:complete len:821 (+),score=165.76 gnl/TRDRNA2_/TRDRNA2_174371_c0_seq23:102-2564(+)
MSGYVLPYENSYTYGQAPYASQHSAYTGLQRIAGMQYHNPMPTPTHMSSARSAARPNPLTGSIRVSPANPPTQFLLQQQTQQQLSHVRQQMIHAKTPMRGRHEQPALVTPDTTMSQSNTTLLNTSKTADLPSPRDGLKVNDDVPAMTKPDEQPLPVKESPAAVPAADPSSAADPSPAGNTSETLLDNEDSPGDERVIGNVPVEELEQDFDLVVIGGGPAGVAGALEGATLGRRVLIADKPKLPPAPNGLDISFGGPTGLFSKALREAGKSIDVKSLKSMGLYEGVIWEQVRGMCMRLATMNAEHQVKTLKDMKVSYLQASATIVSPQKVLVNRQDGGHAIVTTEKVLVATGSKPLRPPEVPFDDIRIFDSDTVNTLAFLPNQVVISGGGIISIEYAKIFRKLGAQVTMLIRSEAKSSLTRIGLDRDIADALLYFLRKDNVTIYEQTSIESYDVPPVGSPLSQKLRLMLKSKDQSAPAELECDIFLAAIGRKPNVTGFGIEKLGVKLAQKGGHIEVNGHFESTVPGIYAAGDVIGPPSLASTGVHQAQGAVASMFDEGGNLEAKLNFPVGMWTTPECAYYGLTKEAAEKKGLRVEEGIAKYTSCLRGRVFAPDGLVKLVFKQEDGVIVGVHLIGADACELVHYGMDLVDQKVTIFALISTLFTAVTYHELFKEAALNGNSKLAFGAQWQTILAELGAAMSTGSEFSEDILRREFEAMDTSGDGSLDADELLTVFNRLGKDVKRGTIANLVRLADADGNGTIEWPEFKTIFEVITRCGLMEESETASPVPQERAPASAATKEVPDVPASGVAMGVPDSAVGA